MVAEEQLKREGFEVKTNEERCTWQEYIKEEI
jgi:hypothetical protein